MRGSVSQVKRSANSRGETQDTLVLLSQPQSALQRSPGCELYYSGAIRGVPHPLAKLVCRAPAVKPQNIVMFIFVTFIMILIRFHAAIMLPPIMLLYNFAL